MQKLAIGLLLGLTLRFGRMFGAAVDTRFNAKATAQWGIRTLAIAQNTMVARELNFIIGTGHMTGSCP